MGVNDARQIVSACQDDGGRPAEARKRQKSPATRHPPPCRASRLANVNPMTNTKNGKTTSAKVQRSGRARHRATRGAGDRNSWRRPVPFLRRRGLLHDVLSSAEGRPIGPRPSGIRPAVTARAARPLRQQATRGSESDSEVTVDAPTRVRPAARSHRPRRWASSSDPR
jgi:hypothetical protein